MLALNFGIDTRLLRASGPRGHITKGDVLSFVASGAVRQASIPLSPSLVVPTTTVVAPSPPQIGMPIKLSAPYPIPVY